MNVHLLHVLLERRQLLLCRRSHLLQHLIVPLPRLAAVVHHQVEVHDARPLRRVRSAVSDDNCGPKWGHPLMVVAIFLVLHSVYRVSHQL